MLQKIKTNITNTMGLVTVWATVVSTAWLIVTSTWVTIESSDITVLTTANGAYLGTAFQSVQFLPTIAIISWGFYILNKLFSIIPSGGWH